MEGLAGPGAYICNECVHLCMSILGDEQDDTFRIRARVWANRVFPQPVGPTMRILDFCSSTLSPPPNQEFLQIDTKNILFICGGAFDGLEKIIERRLDQKTIGFGSDVKTASEREKADVLKSVQPHDLLNSMS